MKFILHIIVKIPTIAGILYGWHFHIYEYCLNMTEKLFTGTLNHNKKKTFMSRINDKCFWFFKLDIFPLLLTISVFMSSFNAFHAQ